MSECVRGVWGGGGVAPASPPKPPFPCLSLFPHSCLLSSFFGFRLMLDAITLRSASHARRCARVVSVVSPWMAACDCLRFPHSAKVSKSRVRGALQRSQRTSLRRCADSFPSRRCTGKDCSDGVNQPCVRGRTTATERTTDADALQEIQERQRIARGMKRGTSEGGDGPVGPPTRGDGRRAGSDGRGGPPRNKATRRERDAGAVPPPKKGRRQKAGENKREDKWGEYTAITAAHKTKSSNTGALTNRERDTNTEARFFFLI